MYIELVFCLNKIICEPLLVTINSILTNSSNSELIRFNIAIPQGEKEFFSSKIKQAFSHTNSIFRLREYSPSNDLKEYLDSKFKEKKPDRKTSRYMQYARLFLKDIFPDLGKVIYLDVDLIVLGDVGELFNKVKNFNQKYYLAAVPQSFSCLLYFSNPFLILDEICQFKQTFNSGVLLTDLSYWDQTTYARLKYYLDLDRKHQYKLFQLGDETVLNLIFKQNYIPLPKEWNCCGYGNHKLVTFFLKKHPRLIKVIHWSGGHQKPWQSNQVIYRDLWASYQLRLSSNPTETDSVRKSLDEPNNFVVI